MTTVNAELDIEDAPAEDVVAYAAKRYGDQLILTSSFQNCVLIDIAARVRPGIHVLFLDTGYHFPETLAYVDDVRRHYGLDVTVARPSRTDCPPCGAEGCCQRRKVEPLDQALKGKQAWMTGVRRADSARRAGTSVVEWDSRRELVKLNPLAAWSDLDMDNYVAEHNLLVHPLTSVGYTSIGCAPTTVPVIPGAHRRSGRWPGTDRQECGIHL